MRLEFKKNLGFHKTASSNKHKHLDQVLPKILWEMNDPQPIQSKARIISVLVPSCTSPGSFLFLRLTNKLVSNVRF